MQTPIQRREVQALLYRARLGMVFRVLAEPKASESHSFDLFKSHAKAMADLLDGLGICCADRDERLGGYATHGVLQAAVTRLPVGFERLTLAQVRAELRRQGVVLDGDPVADGDVNGVQQLVNNKWPIVQLDDEHPIVRVDFDDSSLDSHGASQLVADIVAQGGAA